MTEITLIELFGADAGREISVNRRRCVVGLSHDCDFRPTDGAVSAHHAKLVRGERLTIRDQYSKYGTFVNGKRIFGDRELKHGDVLEIGFIHYFVAMRQFDPKLATKSAACKELAGSKFRPTHSLIPPSDSPGIIGCAVEDRE